MRGLGSALGFVALAAACGHPAWLEGPEAGVRRALDRAGSVRAVAVGSDGLTLRLDRLRFRDPLVTVRDGRAEAVVVADADGALEWRGRPVAVGYLGRERLTLARCPGEGWCIEGAALPRLAALLGTLCRRAEAFDGADAEGYRALVDDAYRGPDGDKGALLRRLAADLAARPRARLRPVAWQVRIERETAQVGEDYDVTVGEGPARRLRARLGLREVAGGWRFTDGL